MAFKSNGVVTPKLRRELCGRLAKVLAYLGCGQPELAKHHAIELQKKLIELGLLIDPARGGCDNGHQTQKTG